MQRIALHPRPHGALGRQHIDQRTPYQVHADAGLRTRIARLDDLQKFYVANGVVPNAAPVKELYTNQFVTGK